jgi:hypothetical protein
MNNPVKTPLTVTGNDGILYAGGFQMALTNAERQAKYRAKMKALGRKRQDAWVADHHGRWPSMTREQLYKEIKNAVSEFTGDDEFLKEAVYAEIAAFVKKAAERYRKYNEQAKALLYDEGRHRKTRRPAGACPG